MDLMEYLVGGQVTTVLFGPTYATIQGYTELASGSYSWWLRLENSFFLKTETEYILNIVEQRLHGISELVKLVSSSVRGAKLDSESLLVEFNNGAVLRSIWSGENLGCGQFDVSTASTDSDPRLVLSVLLPEDI